MNRGDRPTNRENHLMRTTPLKGALLGTTLLAGSAAFAQDVTLTIESWRNDDLAIWQEQIIPAFEASHPGIKLDFTPSAPTEYNAALNSKLDAGSAGDLITCRPFTQHRGLQQGPARRPHRPRGDGELLRRREVRLVDRRRLGDLLRADGERDPRLHLQQGRLRRARDRPSRRPRPSSSPPSTRSRPTAPTSRWRWAPTTSGKPRPWATRTSARTTGRARKAGWRC